MSNFDFLKNDFKDLYEECIEAEENCYKKPRTSVFYSRRALEFSVALVFKLEKIIKPYGDQLKDLINNFKFEELFEKKSQIDALHLIRKIGNTAVHENKNIDYKIALECLKILYDFVVWIGYCYGSLESDDIKFNEDFIPKNIKMEDRAVLNLNEGKIYEDIEAIKKVPVKKHNILVGNHNITEAETRKLYIDFSLTRAGWKLDEKNVREYIIEEVHTKSGKGKIDYVLWGDDGRPLAVVEAKKTMENAKKGEAQALDYAEALEKKFGFFPVRFCTNGFETFIYENKNSIPRKIYGFYKKDELLKIISRRKNFIDEKILLNAVNKEIADRDYQMRAVTKVLENYYGGSRKSLLIMATGAGKTRVAVSIVSALSSLNLINRTLFLADRVALVNQAMNSFKKYLPDFTLCNLVTEKDRENVKVLFSTYQTMMSEAEKVKKDGTNKYGVGAFDLIIVDEAHRSIYQKYGDLFEYFDGLLLGLTATPKDEVDRNTYKVFGMKSNEPTDSYDLFEAAEKGYLVLPKIKEISLNYPENGIIYNNLPEEEKEKYESLFDEDEEIIEEIGGESINSWFFNEGTTEEVIKTLMNEGYKIESGDKLGKTIIFARNDRHADHIVETFYKMYPNSDGNFCKKITTKVERAQYLIEKFSDPDSLPQIAVSVDMLDTGIDIPEILNLVFYKKVKSKSKFWQMIGRGTRKCPNIFGYGKGKKDFMIFDFCGNFSYFEMEDNFEKSNVKIPESLTSRIFSKKIKLIYKLNSLEYLDNSNEEKREKYKKLRKDLIESVYKDICSLNEENISVKMEIGYVKKYKDREKDFLNYLDEKAVEEITEHLRKMPFKSIENSEEEKRFENFILDFQLNLSENKNIEKEIKKIKETAEVLFQKGNIKEIREKGQIISDIVKSKDYFQNVDILKAEEIKNNLKPLMNFMEKREQEIIYGDLKDKIVKTSDKDLSFGRYDFINLKEKFQQYLEENKDMISIKKLRFNQPLDDGDIIELNNLLYKNKEVDFCKLKEEYSEEFKKIQENYNVKEPLGIFLRSLIGLDQEAVNKEFSNFLDKEKFNGNQIELIEMIIKNFIKNGAYDKKEMRETSKIIGKDIMNVFPLEDLFEIASIIDKINNNSQF